MKKILITGGLGFIGSHTCVALHESGFEPIIIDNLSNSSLTVLDGLEKITGEAFTHYNLDICDKGVIDEVIKDHPEIEGIIHFAAFKAVGESVNEPLKYYHNNLLGLINVLNAIKKHNLPKMVFSSSCTVYGDTKKSPITENAPIVKAASPYGNTKQIGEEIIEDFCAAFDKQIVSLRYFNPVGAHPSALIGELPIGVPNNLIPYITQTAIGQRKEITIFGDDYSTKDGTCIRDYIHVVDLAFAHVKALQVDSKNMSVFNIGTGNGSSVLEVIQCFEKVNNLKLNYKIGPRRDGDIEQIWASTILAETELGWKAKYVLSDMMKHAWQWQKTLQA